VLEDVSPENAARRDRRYCRGENGAGKEYAAEKSLMGLLAPDAEMWLSQASARRKRPWFEHRSSTSVLATAYGLRPRKRLKICG